MKALSQSLVIKSNNVFATFGKQAAAYTVAPHANIAAELPRDARPHYNALSPVGKVAALFQDEATARDIFVRDGDNYEVAQGRFFLSSVALYLHMGDEAARGVVREAWADSKDKRREYALKIFRLCAKAVEAGHLDGVRNVTGFASLQALQPKKEAAEKSPVESTPLGNTAIAASATDAAQDERAKMVAQATSRAADIAAQLSRMAEIANAISAACTAESLDVDALAQWAGDLNVLRASLETLTV